MVLPIALALFTVMFYYLYKYLTILAIVEEDTSWSDTAYRLALLATSVALGIATVIEVGRAIVK